MPFFSKRNVAFAISMVLGALGFNAAASPALAAETSTVIEGVYYGLDGSGGVLVYGFDGQLNEVDYPSELTFESSVEIAGSTYPVTGILDNAFWNVSSLVSVTIPESVTSIGSYAFMYDEALTEINLPSTLTSIGEEAFADTSSLTSITIPAAVTSIGQAAFWRATALQEVNFLGPAPKAGRDMFYENDPTVYYFARFGADVVSGGFTPYWQGVKTRGIVENLEATPRPVVVGSAKVGERLTAVAGDWDAGVTLAYQWLRNGIPIAGATASEYGLGYSDLGSKFQVNVSGFKVGFLTVSKTSAESPIVDVGVQSLTPIPTVVGTMTVGQTLTANPGVWDSRAALSYKWFRGTTILGSTSTYTLTPSDFSAVVTVVVSGELTGYLSASRTSLATVVVAAATISPVGKPTISGSYKVGQSLVAKPGNWMTGVVLTYQWLLDGKPIKGATTAKYKIGKTLKGHALNLSVSGTTAGFNKVSLLTAKKKVS